MLRLITDGKVSPEEAVRAYHGVLQGKGIKPHRALEDDLKHTDQSMSYDGSATRRSTVAQTSHASGNERPASGKSASDGWPKLSDGKPDFTRMTSAQRRSYDEARLTQRFG